MQSFYLILEIINVEIFLHCPTSFNYTVLNQLRSEIILYYRGSLFLTPTVWRAMSSYCLDTELQVILCSDFVEVAGCSSE
jgi:hypothetical protein